MNNRILFIMGVNSRKAGGLFFTITSVVNKLIENFDKNIAVFGFYDEYSNDDIKEYKKSVKLIEYNLEDNFLSKIGYSLNLKNKLIEYKPNIIHQQGIWLYYSKEVFNIKKNTDVKVIIQPHGMLDPWALKNSYLKKKIISFLYEKNNLNSADCLHALNYQEYKAIRNYGLKQPIAIIPNGVDINKSENQLEDNHNKKSFSTRKLLYLGRIHPKKGIELIIQAINIIVKEKKINFNWIIQIAGWDQSGHQEYLKNKIQELDLNCYFEFLGPVFGDDKEKNLLDASGFILPSYSEGLPMTILEAWSYNLPVLMTKYCNLDEGFNCKAAIEIMNDAHHIADSLIIFFKMTDLERYVMGNNGYKLVQDKFTWNSVAEQTNELYDWLINSSSKKPNFVILD